MLMFASLVSTVFPSRNKSYKILCFVPTASKEEVLNLQLLLAVLASKGHKVTVVSQYPIEKRIKNYRDIVVSADQRPLLRIFRALVRQTSGYRFNRLWNATDLILSVVDDKVNNVAIKNILNEDVYDLVIHGSKFSLFHVGLGTHFKCPSIVLCSSFVKEEQTIRRTPRTILANLVQFMNSFILDSISEIQYNKYFTGPYPSYQEAKQNIGMVLFENCENPSDEAKQLKSIDSDDDESVDDCDTCDIKFLTEFTDKTLENSFNEELSESDSVTDYYRLFQPKSEPLKSSIDNTALKIEHLIRHKGTLELGEQVNDLYLCQNNSFDGATYIFVIIFLISSFITWILSVIKAFANNFLYKGRNKKYVN